MTIPRIPHQMNVPSDTAAIRDKKADAKTRTRQAVAKGTKLMIPGEAAKARTARLREENNIRLNFTRLVAEKQLGQDPWARLPGETDIQWERFNQYLHMVRLPGQLHRRTYDRMAGHLGISRNVVAEAGEKWHWKLRALCWDTEMERVEHEEFTSLRRASVRRQARLGGKLQDLALIGAENMIAIRGADLSAQDVARLADTGVKIERLAHGDATSHEARQTEMRVVWDGPTPGWAASAEEVRPITQEERHEPESD